MTAKTPGLTASIYLRRSKSSDAKSVSLAMQEREVRELCSGLGADVVKVFVDDGQSGGSSQAMKRKAWRDWLDSASTVDVLASWALDRATRSGLIGAAAIIEAITPTGTRFVTVDGLDSDTAEFDLLIGIKAAFAKAEWTKASERSKATRREKVARGQHPSGAAPYGCRVNADGCLEADPTESTILREAAMRIANGDGVRSALRWMNNVSRTRRGATWTRSSLTASLESASTSRHILSGSEREAVVAALHPRPGTKKAGGRPRKWLLAGSGTCAGCERPLTTSRDAQRDVTRYVCRSAHDGRPCPAPATIRADRVDEYLTNTFLDLFGDFPHFEERLIVDGGDRDAARQALEAAQAALLERPRPETLAAYQVAQERAEVAESQPVRREVKLIQGRTVRDVWEAAGQSPGDVDHAARIALFWQFADSVSVAKASTRGGQFDVNRVKITWGKDVPTAPSRDEVA